MLKDYGLNMIHGRRGPAGGVTMKARWASWFALAVLGVGLLAPILANDRPIVARVDGELRFPALCDYVGEPAPGPGGKPWKQWWYELGPDTTDWAVMPFIPYGPFEVNLKLINKGPVMLSNYLGNDDTGRDVLARLIHGAGTATWIALGVVLMSAVIGVALGAWSGYRGGWVDVLVQRLIEIFLCFPALFFVLAVPKVGRLEYSSTASCDSSRITCWITSRSPSATVTSLSM